MSLTVRPATESDLDHILEVAIAADDHDGAPYVTTADDVSEVVSTPGFEMGLHAVLAEDDGRPVGFAWAVHRPAAVDGPGRVSLGGGVAPDARRKGVGSALVAAQLDMSRQAIANGWHVYAWHWDWMSDTTELFVDNGFRLVRHFEVMRRALPAAPHPRDLVTGLELVGWDENRSEEARTAMNRAFEGTWGVTPLTAAEWNHRVTGDGFLPALSGLVVDEGTVVGVATARWYPADEETTGRREAWLERIGVVPEARRTGAGGALIERFLQNAAAAGFSHAALAVDYSNESGANTLYQRFGFESVHRTNTMVYEP